jgi:UDP-N-acetylglucosamine 2-epimerase (non-hydrolysing)
MNDRILTILGTRPEIIRLSVIIPKLDQILGLENHFVLHTGQNYTPGLSDIFFQELNLRPPNLILDNQNTTFAQQLSNVFVGIEQVIQQFRPTKALILGDTNSGLSAIVCERMGIPVYHMEAGNRCYDLSVPEEKNRRLIDSISTYNLPYTELSRQNLLREGLPNNRIAVIGNPIKEVLEFYHDQIDNSKILSELGLQVGQYVIATAHRAENVDDQHRLKEIMMSLTHIGRDCPVVFSCHPRTKNKIQKFNISTDNVNMVDPLGFFDFVHLEKNSRLAISDSGTVQEEMCLLGVPTITIRNTTERPETQWCGSNIVSGLSAEDIIKCYEYINYSTPPSWDPPVEYTKKNVSDTVINLLISTLKSQ